MLQNTANKFDSLFEKQQQNQFHLGNTNYKTRIQKLKKLQKAVEYTYREAIQKALYSDFKKPFAETDLTEIYPVVSEIKFACKHLKQWLKPQKVETPLALMGTSSWYQHEPKGVCLIMAPWNFPLNLTFGPLVSAIAAGNTVILKPSEMTPHIAQVMAEIIEDLFPEEEVALVQGEVEVSQELLKQPFNHIFFTGSPGVGKLVMKAASAHLTSVTLELGGKSPTIIDDTANLKLAAKRIAWGKFINNGQICLSPDYVLVKESVKDAFVEALQLQLKAFYSEDPKDSPAYCRVVNRKHFDRLVAHLENAKKLQASFDIGGESKIEDCYIAPTVVSNLPDEASLLQEEIFGPILPIKTYNTVEDILDYVNAKSKPLALYIYSRNKRFINQILKNTRAGSTAINANVLQYSNHYLPFGGSNTSGIGKSHGYFGFQEFSNQRAVLKQHIGGAIELLFPPYTSLKQKLIDMTIKWF
ncbi:aldehyde dehydrogenase family protein [Mangrovimonas sp. TPBH4]|uniref:aldehyde dehydrogenase family protein n=1 Tax=Mangrovimonas sp. TPBH4 TaxID=1645914 RepID=UPI0006B5A354|nr:aldehyde dehydrogenase family protein [Mangrovimonas sp. TPBH4]